MDIHNINLDYSGEKPLYKQLYEYIHNSIQSGRYMPGDKLPAKRELAKAAGVSVNTVISVYDALSRDGIITAVERSGYFVSGTASSEPFKGAPWFVPDARKYVFSLNGSGIQRFSKKLVRAIRDTEYDLEKKLLSYKEYTGNAALREKICEYLYHTRHMRCSSEQVILGTSITGLLDTCIRFLDRDFIYAVENPRNFKFEPVVTDNRQYVFIPEFYDRLNMDAIRESGADVFLCQPEKQFPMGHTMSVKERLDLLNWASDGKYIIEYGYKCEFNFQGAKPSLYELSEKENIIYMNNFQEVAAPAVTLSYMVLPQRLIELFKSKLKHFHCYVSEFDSLLMLEFISNKGIYANAKRLKKLYKNKCDTAIAAFKALPIADKLEFMGTENGTHFCIRVNSDIAAAELSARLRRYDIKLLSIASFYSDLSQKPTDEDRKIFAFGYAEPSEADICDGIKLIGEAWKDI